MSSRPDTPASAWTVHLFTASGVIFALLSLSALQQGDERTALGWLGIALVIDGVDGWLARRMAVADRLPNIDGSALDLVVDYLTYVFVPAILIWKGEYLLPAVAFPLIGAIMISSLYVFARRDMKTDDGYFQGFPALWNVIALYFVVATPSATVATAVVVVLIVMTFAPVHVVHPFRAKGYGAVLPIVAVGWGAFTAPLLLPGLGVFAKSFLLVMSLAAAAVLVVMGLLRTVREARSQ